MEHIRNIGKMKRTCVAFGRFDGVHIGHQAIVKRVVEESEIQDCTSVIISCYSKKRMQREKILSTEQEKAYFFEKMGVDTLISFDIDEYGAEKEAFIREIVIGKIDARIIVIGEENDDVELIKRVAQENGVTVLVVGTVEADGQAVTDESVRAAVLAGRFDEISGLCGHPYVMMGEVEHGKALGRTVGMPTANLGVSKTKIMVPHGVYATLTKVGDCVYRGVTNVGTRPSVDDMSYVTVETLLLGFSGDIYGETLVTEIHHYVRGVQKFGGLEEVQQQVQKDIVQVKDYLDERWRKRECSWGADVSYCIAIGIQCI